LPDVDIHVYFHQAKAIGFMKFEHIATMLVAIAPAPAVAFGLAGYIAPIVVVTVGYALFQTANNTVVMADVRPDQRGVVSGMLNLSRNLGFVTGASVMGAVFALALSARDITRPGQLPSPAVCGLRLPWQQA
jgi:predicted MFS family arabinose efflux permease